MKTKDAFALRGFDCNKILQRPLFKRFYFPDTTDKKILQELTNTEKTSRKVLEKNLAVLEELRQSLDLYFKLVTNSADRLSKLSTGYFRAMEDLEKLIIDLIPKPPPRRRSFGEGLLLASLRQKEKENKLDEIGKLEEYQRLLSLGDATQESLFSYLTILEKLDELRNLVEDSHKALNDRIKKFNRKIFADNLKKARQECAFTQKAVASRLGMTQNSYSSYEIGRADPPLTNLIRLSQILNCSVDSLLGIT